MDNIDYVGINTVSNLLCRVLGVMTSDVVNTEGCLLMDEDLNYSVRVTKESVREDLANEVNLGEFLTDNKTRSIGIQSIDVSVSFRRRTIDLVLNVTTELLRFCWVVSSLAMFDAPYIGADVNVYTNGNVSTPSFSFISSGSMYINVHEYIKSLGLVGFDISVSLSVNSVARCDLQDTGKVRYHYFNNRTKFNCTVPSRLNIGWRLVRLRTHRMSKDYYEYYGTWNRIGGYENGVLG